MSDYRIMFLRDSYRTDVAGKTHPGAPVGCVAIHAPKDGGKLQYQLSVLNPVDRFDRSVARKLALGGIIESPITLKLRQGAGMHEITETVMLHIASSNAKAPARARRAAQLWLRWNDL